MSLDERQQHFDTTVSQIRIGMLLLTLAELGVFTALLEGPLTGEALAERVSATPHRLRAFLDLGVQHNFLAREGEQYRLQEGDEAIFVSILSQMLQHSVL